MILKDYVHRPDADPRSEETCAESATRLRNAFKTNEDVLLLNDIRMKFDEDRTVNVDHVVLHSYGITLINSRAIYGKIDVNYRGEWSRNAKGRDIAMQNPIDLYKYISKNLRENLTSNIGKLLTRTKSTQRTFDNMPIDVLFIQALKSSIIGTGINQSNIIFVEALTQNINRTFVAYKKREFQMYGGLDTFKISQPDMYAIANFLMGNEIDRSSYPDSDEHTPSQVAVPAVLGRTGIIRAHSTLSVKIIKGKNIKPGKETLALLKKQREEQQKIAAKKQQLAKEAELAEQVPTEPLNLDKPMSVTTDDITSMFDEAELEPMPELEPMAELEDALVEEELAEQALDELPEIDEQLEAEDLPEPASYSALEDFTTLDEVAELEEQPEMTDDNMDSFFNEAEAPVADPLAEKS